jgi:signal transduction histidine kinase
METIGPAARPDAMGPLRRLVWAPEVPRPPARRRGSAYFLPLSLLALVGLGFSAGQYLLGNRNLVTAAVVPLAVGSVLPVLVTYRRPLLAWRLAFVMMFLGVVNAGRQEPWPWNPVQILGFLLVMGRLAVTQKSGVTVWATVLSLVPVFLFASPAGAWGAAILIVAIAALGDIVSRRRSTRELLAEQTEITDLERARRAVLEERTRIAREMHDVVAHHMSMIAVRAETAPYRVEGMPESARAELETIATAARTALTDMRRLLGVLRSENDETLTAPQPAWSEVNDLVTTARQAGLDVSIELDGVDEVPTTVGLAAYRIVQEALANAARHAPGGPVSVAGRGRGNRLELTVRNPLPEQRRGPEKNGPEKSGPEKSGPEKSGPEKSGPAISTGHGLAGMRERATLLGGVLIAEPSGTDFVVHADLPYVDGRPPQ